MCSKTYESSLLPWTCFPTVGSSYYCCVSSTPNCCGIKHPPISCAQIWVRSWSRTKLVSEPWHLGPLAGQSQGLEWPEHSGQQSSGGIFPPKSGCWYWLLTGLSVGPLARTPAHGFSSGLCVGKCGFHHRRAAGFQEWVSPKQPDGSSPWKTHGITFPTVPQAHLDSRGGNTNPIYWRKES